MFRRAFVFEANMFFIVRDPPRVAIVINSIS